MYCNIPLTFYENTLIDFFYFIRFWFDLYVSQLIQFKILTFHKTGLIDRWKSHSEIKSRKSTGDGQQIFISGISVDM